MAAIYSHHMHNALYLPRTWINSPKEANERMLKMPKLNGSYSANSTRQFSSIFRFLMQRWWFIEVFYIRKRLSLHALVCTESLILSTVLCLDKRTSCKYDLTFWANIVIFVIINIFERKRVFPHARTRTHKPCARAKEIQIEMDTDTSIQTCTQINSTLRCTVHNCCTRDTRKRNKTNLECANSWRY